MEKKMIKKQQTILKPFLALLLIGFVFTVPAKAQLGDIGTFLKAGADDASKLTKEYLRPYPTGFGTGLNAGFTETAAPKKLLGFSLQIRPSLAVVPADVKSFDVNSLGLQKIQVAPGNNPVTPTIAGANQAGPLLEIYETATIGGVSHQVKLSEFTMMEGLNFGYVPAPIVQASVGLIRETDVTLRLLPQISVGEFGDISVLGGAVKHSISQYIPGDKIFPVDISVLVGFNKMNINGNLDLQPESGASNENASNPNPDFDSQKLSASFNTFVVNAYVGKTLPFISVYGGLGYQTAKFDLKLKGNYPVPFLKDTDPTGKYYTVMNNPFGFTIESDSNISALAGLRLKLGPLAIYGEATFANYITLNAGFGVSIR